MCLLTADGSSDEKVNPEGLKDYKVMPPLPMAGPDKDPDLVAPQPASDPTDMVIEDEIFSSIPNDATEEETIERVDDETDHTINYELVGQKIKGLYETGWHVGHVKYFNTFLKEYLVEFNDGSTDYIKKEDIDCLQIMLVQETRTSGRSHKEVNYKRLAESQE